VSDDQIVSIGWYDGGVVGPFYARPGTVVRCKADGTLEVLPDGADPLADGGIAMLREMGMRAGASQVKECLRHAIQQIEDIRSALGASFAETTEAGHLVRVIRERDEAHRSRKRLDAEVCEAMRVLGRGVGEGLIDAAKRVVQERDLARTAREIATLTCVALERERDIRNATKPKEPAMPPLDDDERDLTIGERNRRFRERTEAAIEKVRSDRQPKPEPTPPLVAGGPEREAYAWSIVEVLIGGALVTGAVVGLQWALGIL